ncbi:anhydro-N-acetylmuramic acid kinase [candidate division KSB1 bacterium]
MKKISEKNERLVIGLMSGTSLDGIDCALVKINGSGINSTVTKIDFKTYPFPEGFQDFLKSNLLQGETTLKDVSQTNVFLGELFADAVENIIRSNNLKASDIDLIGSHGQTIWHNPAKEKMFGKMIHSSMQSGSVSTIAKLTKILTVGNFRMADLALGGEGAPLIPYFDYTFFRSDKENRVLLNIGGISNITVIPAGCDKDEIIAFDCGPGNVLVDNLINRYFKNPFDYKGEIAKTGKISEELFEKLKNHAFLKKSPPKSTGREEFSEKYLDKNLKTAENLKLCTEDIITTFSEFTPYAVFYNIREHLSLKPDRLIISGGGVNNEYFLERLKFYLPETVISKSDDYGIDAESKEAIAFAFYAGELINEISINLKNVTGAFKYTLCGELGFP